MAAAAAAALQKALLSSEHKQAIQNLLRTINPGTAKRAALTAEQSRLFFNYLKNNHWKELQEEDREYYNRKVAAKETPDLRRVELLLNLARI